MKKGDITVLSEKYSNWKFKEGELENQVLYIEGGVSDQIQLFDLLKELQAIVNNEYSIKIDINKLTIIEIHVLANSQSKKYRKMYTSGCFDIFHYGHLNILKKTKELCDYLVVGVSTDELIEKEKGRKPVIPFVERMNIVKSIKYVDEVIPQVDKNKQRVVDQHCIDAISVGDDWRGI